MEASATDGEEEEEQSDDEFCILEHPDKEPEGLMDQVLINCLVHDEIKLVENHFAVPVSVLYLEAFVVLNAIKFCSICFSVLGLLLFRSDLVFYFCRPFVSFIVMLFHFISSLPFVSSSSFSFILFALFHCALVWFVVFLPPFVPVFLLFFLFVCLSAVPYRSFIFSFSSFLFSCFLFFLLSSLSFFFLFVFFLFPLLYLFSSLCFHFSLQSWFPPDRTQRPASGSRPLPTGCVSLHSSGDVHRLANVRWPRSELNKSTGKQNEKVISVQARNLDCTAVPDKNYDELQLILVVKVS